VPPIGTLRVRESESTTTIFAAGLELVVVRRVGTDPGHAQTVTATWSNEHIAVPLAGLSLT
jgi:hypothetical protein